MKFKINDIPVQLFLGVPNEERVQKQEILISLKFKFDTTKAEKSDEIKDTVDYFEIYQLVQNFPKEKEFQLIEHLYHELESELKTNFPLIKNWKIKIQKFPFESGSVSISK